MARKWHIAILLMIALFGYGCSGHATPNLTQQQFADLISHYRQGDEPLSIRKLTQRSAAAFPGERDSIDVSILVHPGYSVFVNNVIEKTYAEPKFKLMKKQFETESAFIQSQARQGNVVILILPAGIGSHGDATHSYSSYLNRISSRGDSIFYLFSRTKRNGSLDKDEMITLYRFLRSLRPGRVLIGGGYIGRCQEEFLHQLATFIDREQIYVVPEISTISPRDISESEALRIVTTLEQRDYTLVKSFISDKTKGDIRFLSIPQTYDRYEKCTGRMPC